MKTQAAKWKAEERQRHKKAGRVAVTVYVRPEFRAEIRILEAQLRMREAGIRRALKESQK